jgi:hypothetical protein
MQNLWETSCVKKTDRGKAVVFTSQNLFLVPTRVARWFVFKPKIPIWVNFGGSCNRKDHLVYFTAIGNISRPFGIFSPVLVYCTKKNRATLVSDLEKTAKAKQKQDSFGFPRAAGPFRQIRLIASLTGSR